jgi:hypothetical protein
MKPKTLYEIIAMLIIGIIALCLLLAHSCDRSDHQDKIISAIQDTLHLSRDKDGRQTATIEAYEGTVKDLRNEVKSDKVTIKRLQALGKEYGNKLVAAASINFTTIDHASGVTTVIPKDTIKDHGIIYLYPLYTDTIVKPWASYKVRADKDSIHVDSETKQAMDVSFIGFKKVNPFKKDGLKTMFDAPKINLRINLQNPDSGVTEAHAFVKDGKRQYNGIKVVAGILSLEALRIGLTGKP